MFGALKVSHMQWGELQYIGGENEIEPSIDEDRILITAKIRLSRRRNPANFQMKFTMETEDGELIEQFVSHRPIEFSKHPKKQRTLHFETPELFCKTQYKCELIYKDNVLPISSKQELFINTPPARQDPQPLKVAIGGDQERFEQFGFLGKLFDLNNYEHTKKIYKHIGSEGNPNALPTAPIEEQPYQLMIHLGDLFNGEVYFSLSNLFRPNRKIFERKVQSKEAYDDHLNKDTLHPTKKNLKRACYGFYNGSDDHDTLGNGGGEPVTKKEITARGNMEKSFHKNVLLPQFTKQESDGYGPVKTPGGRKGPYFKKRFGQHEFFILHNRMTQEKNALNRSFLLGEEQWIWLENSLKTSQASNKVIISPLPFVMGKNPGEDYRAHWEEWHRFMQLCRKYQVGTILTADSHNYSSSEIHVKENIDDEPWVIHHQLIGTLGGSKQFITSEEMAEINKLGRPPLLPKGDGFNPLLYEGSRVNAYFSPGDKKALLPVENEKAESQWTKKNEWRKHTHGYVGTIFTPKVDEAQIIHPLHYDELDELSMDTEGPFLKQPTLAMPYQVKASFFGCSRRKEMAEENRLSEQYEVSRMWGG